MTLRNQHCYAGVQGEFMTLRNRHHYAGVQFEFMTLRNQHWYAGHLAGTEAIFSTRGHQGR